MTGRIITSDACLAEGMAYLIKVEPRFARVEQLAGGVKLRQGDTGFKRLLWAIVGQQVSVASAEAVWARLGAAKLDTPQGILSASDEELRGQGLSRQKIRYARALTQSDIDYNALEAASDEDVLRILTSVTGIGRWTAEVYLMFALGRADVIAAGDLAMQEAVREIFELPQRPSEKELRELAQAWRPWRAVAGRLLWDYYLRDRSTGE